MPMWEQTGTKADHHGVGTWTYYRCAGQKAGWWSSQQYRAVISYNKTVHQDNFGTAIVADEHVSAHIDLLNKGTQGESEHAVSYYVQNGVFTAFPVFFPLDLQTYIRDGLTHVSGIP